MSQQQSPRFESSRFKLCLPGLPWYEGRGKPLPWFESSRFNLPTKEEGSYPGLSAKRFHSSTANGFPSTGGFLAPFFFLSF